ncbi:Transcription initiation factor TFIID subunit 5 [Sporothrix curviconia]|uniref:Transcription initiation factor TFIID subunit 5 n=1 Tax=Sporothrix curviconia TaxID=1260050 RepID=A0ABP0BK21_9PEZI
MVEQNFSQEARAFLKDMWSDFENTHGDDLRTFETVQLPIHVTENRTTKIYRSTKYRIPLNRHVSGQLFGFLERQEDAGGSVITLLLQTYCQIDSTARGPIEPFSFEAIARRSQNADLDEADVQEGIPGVFTGVSNRDILDTHASLKLGPLPMELELRDDVRAELEEQDQRQPPAAGVPSLVSEFDAKIKQEEGADAPSRTDLPLPPSRARDVIMEMQKIRERPVFRVLWSPQGHYFMTAGWDKTVRIFTQDHASAQRLLVGHNTSISAIAWHSNGTYVFSASDETDKTIRMWSVIKGDCVRVFTGHPDYITSLECAPNGRILASADIGGNIIIWDIAKGTRIKRCRGHAKGGISSLSFSAESTVLVSGGLDGTLRLWDINLPKDVNKVPALLGGPAGSASASTHLHGDATGGGSDSVAGGNSQDRSITVGGQPPSPATAAASGGAASNSGAGKKKGKEVTITPDQISAFATKKTPILRAEFTRMNLVVASGCFDP